MNRRDSENLLGSVETFHCVILATGYQHHFSFITDESLRLRISGNAGLDTYRNKGGYRSVFTGLVSVPRRTPWMSEKNDSLDALMREMGDEAPG